MSASLSASLSWHSLSRAFEITYVKIAFHLSRPESFAIYKKMSPDGPWIPYQFYSESCQSTYNLPKNEKITDMNEHRATCTNAHSGITPLVGDRVTFSTLEGRPSGKHFHDSPMLQEWVTATHIRIALNRINTLGDQAFKDSKTMQSYYYAIYDVAIGGNGGPGGTRGLRPKL
ncbi:hypothetical protein HELRODRAFT_179490 [Helobdella robusta]|uniref:Laminin N-terminal domain-containing protein n=1 Tax=Helobdella robusta TaxID=6412 RepID=T1FES8_HELRO|nr:hypothetical protein HELRODRAFT_179490 [Helobdella robusta]ESN95415.1 hypothetical protein HELRODRAFT_179490 [Helobdella robusta]